MSALVIAASASLCGLGGAFAPRLIRAVPEPEPVAPDPADPAATDPTATDSAPEEGAADDASEAGLPAVEGDVAVTAPADAAVEEEPKILYADLGARPRLAVWTALVSALAGGLLGWRLGADVALLVLLPLVPVMVALSVIDWHTRLLPTWVIRPTYFVTVGLVLAAAALSWDGDALLRSVLGWLALGAFYFVLWFINSGGLGYGDVRLSGILGLAVGYVGWAELLTGAWAGFLVGGVLGGLLALFKVVDRKGVPFGPFMVAGVLIGVLLGPAVGARLG